MTLLMRVMAVILSVALSLIDVFVVMFGMFSAYCMVRFFLDMRKSKTEQERNANKESAIIYGAFVVVTAVIAFVITAGIMLILRGM